MKCHMCLFHLSFVHVNIICSLVCFNVFNVLVDVSFVFHEFVFLFFGNLLCLCLNFYVRFVFMYNAYVYVYMFNVFVFVFVACVSWKFVVC
jgi:hypothetical protein